MDTSPPPEIGVNRTAMASSGGPGAAKPLSSHITPWLMVVLVVVLLSGGLFGYDQGVISGALAGIRARFSLDPLIVEVVTSGVTLGALFGALAAGELADRIGRKFTVLIAASNVQGPSILSWLGRFFIHTIGTKPR